jgi:hypothetical protein
LRRNVLVGTLLRKGAYNLHISIININLGASRVIFENLSVVVFYFADNRMHARLERRLIVITIQLVSMLPTWQEKTLPRIPEWRWIMLLWSIEGEGGCSIATKDPNLGLASSERTTA